MIGNIISINIAIEFDIQCRDEHTLNVLVSTSSNQAVFYNTLSQPPQRTEEKMNKPKLKTQGGNVELTQSTTRGSKVGGDGFQGGGGDKRSIEVSDI